MLTVDIIGHAESSTGDSWPQARLMADSQGRAGIWHATGGHNTPAWSGPANAVTAGATPGTWQATRADGTTVTVTKAGCGCGTPLRALGEMDLATLVVPT